MTPRDPQRRRLIGGLVALVCAGATGMAWWSRDATPTAGPTAPTSSTTTTSSTPMTAPTSSSPPPSTTGSPPTTAAEPTTTTAGPNIVKAAQVLALCRQAWGAREPSGEFAQHRIERMTVHHTASVLGSATEAPGRARGHQRYHQGLGWPDLAYHFMVDSDGNVLEGRPVMAVGDTATAYDPTGHFLVCLEGNFDEQHPTAVQLDTLVALLAWASDRFDVASDTIRGHRDWAATRCPGNNLYPLIADGTIAAAVDELRAAGGVDLEVWCGAEAAARVTAIEAGA